MSKRQRKKILKLQKFEERKKLLRKREKEKKKLKKSLAREQGLQLVPRGPTRKQLKKNLKEVRKNDEITVVIDMGFDELMLDKDLSSCSAQVLRIYSANRRSDRPLPVHLTSLDANGKLYEKLERNDGWQHWDLEKHPESYFELFDKDKIIYLTSESDNVLTDLEKGAVYVIGGLVDHNQHKGLSFKNAINKGIRTARLPLSEHLVMKTRSVLTINQVFEIILGVSEGKEWKDVLINTLPQRKNVEIKKTTENE